MADLSQNPREELEFLADFAEFVDAAQHIASLRIRKMKRGVVAKRDFAKEMAILFSQVKQSYLLDVASADSQNADLAFLKKNGRTAYVLLSSNSSLYGEIVHKTFEFFTRFFDPTKADAVIIGKFGKNLFEMKYPGIEYTFFEFSEQRVEPENFRWVIEHLVRYEKILVFYGEFQSLIKQNPTMVSISGDQIEIETAEEEKTRYLLEPTPENVLIFFETQILAAIFEQTLYEAQLAKFASRMLSMHYIHENIQRRKDEALFEILRLEHELFNKKQLDRLAGSRLWQKF